jgi:hypothetical protein
MATLYAPPEIMSAYAYAIDGSEPDMQLGTHLRIFAGIGASFPLTPFVVLKLASQSSKLRGIHVTDQVGNVVSGLHLSDIGVGEATLLLDDDDTRRTVRIDLISAATGAIKGAQLLDQRDRVIAERNTERWMFSAPILHKLRVWGHAENVEVLTRAVDIKDITGEDVFREPAGILGLPISGLHPWYLGLQERNDGLNRVANGAPMRLNFMDRPNGPLDSVGPDEEVARIEAMLKSVRLGGGLESLLLNLVDDNTLPPWLQLEKEVFPPGTGGGKQFVSVPRLSNLQLAALDPGLARFFGFAARFDDLPDLSSGRGWDTLAVIGLFAIDPKAFDDRDPRLGRQLREDNPSEGGLIEKLVLTLETESGSDIRSNVEEIMAAVKARGLVVRAFVTLVAPVPPWLPPRLPQPDLLQHRWQTTTDNSPSSLYRISFAFSQALLASMSAVATQIVNWVSRHGTIDIDGFQPPSRAMPRFFGHEQESRSRLDELRRISGTYKHAGLLADQDIPAGAGSIPYRIRASDFFGRFGDPVDFLVGPPPRPAPPPPVLRFHIERAEIDLDSEVALSPGVLKLTIAVPRTVPSEPFSFSEKGRLASAIVVPRIDDLAAGSLHLTSLDVTLGAQSRTVDLSVAGFTDVEFPLPPLLPQRTLELTLSAVFRDTDNVASNTVATLLVTVVDSRPPKAIPTGIGLYWSSVPGPSPEVELKLAWPASPDSLYRVYLTDEHGLALSTSDLADPRLPKAEPSRGRVAQVGCNKVLDGASVDRAGFRLLTDEPIKAGTDSRAVLATTLPRSLETVQFLRVVPLSAEGAEAPFDKCGIVPVAVPDSRRPPPPRLDGEVDAATGFARLHIIADSFDRVLLERDEPGIFNPHADVGQPPEFRIRRAVGAVADPIYARYLVTGPLTWQATMAPATVFSTMITDDNSGRGLEPFVRYVYWAEVRLPPERRLPAGAVPIDPAGGISSIDPANAANRPRPMSLFSAPRVLMHVPQGVPAPPLHSTVNATREPPDSLGNIEVIIKIIGAPHAHAKAIGPYRLAVWFQWPGQAIEPVTIANGSPIDGTWPALDKGGMLSVSVHSPPAILPASSPLDIRLAIIDPIGRMSSTTTTITVS